MAFYLLYSMKEQSSLNNQTEVIDQDHLKEMEEFIALAIREDIVDPTGRIATGDHSALACIPAGRKGSAKLLVKADGILSGVGVAEMVCLKVDPGLSMDIYMNDGVVMKHGDVAFHMHGSERSILQAERLILNFMQRMSGIATNTHRYVDAVAGTRTRVLDTRKTTPGLRAFEKWAVRTGGGHNHRFGLYDMIMLKDNHIDFCGGIRQAILAVKAYQEAKGLILRVEVETRTLADIEEVMKVGYVDQVMFDNFTPELVAQGLKIVGGKYETEVSGGITLDTIRRYAEAGPDYISVGALTHSSVSLDLSLKKI
jgi:nicotinate-nucleotide pyrophosphorylase (carboxylating)